MTCDHFERRQVLSTWINDYTGEEESEWVEEQICLTEDIALGAFKCKRCGEVGYYTGAWKKFYENRSEQQP